MSGKKIIDLIEPQMNFLKRLSLYTDSWDTDAQTVEQALYFKCTEE
jgi:hypothetical protein